MRRTLIALLLAAAVPAFAQQQPAGLEPIPEPPPIPAEGAEVDEPEVTILQRGEDTVTEYRIRGKLYMVKVTPAVGKPYYLVDRQGDGNFIESDTIGPMTKPPMWILHSW